MTSCPAPPSSWAPARPASVESPHFIVTPSGSKYSRKDVLALLEVFMDFKPNEHGEGPQTLRFRSQIDHRAIKQAMLKHDARGEKKVPLTHSAFIRALDVTDSGTATFEDVLLRCYPLATPSELKIMQGWAFPEDACLTILSDEQIAVLQAKIDHYEEKQGKPVSEQWQSRHLQRRQYSSSGLATGSSAQGQIGTQRSGPASTGTPISMLAMPQKYEELEEDAFNSNSCHVSTPMARAGWQTFTRANSSGSFSVPSALRSYGMPGRSQSSSGADPAASQSTSSGQVEVSHASNGSLSLMGSRGLSTSSRSLFVQASDMSSQTAKAGVLQAWKSDSVCNTPSAAGVFSTTGGLVFSTTGGVISRSSSITQASAPDAAPASPSALSSRPSSISRRDVTLVGLATRRMGCSPRPISTGQMATTQAWSSQSPCPPSPSPRPSQPGFPSSAALKAAQPSSPSSPASKQPQLSCPASPASRIPQASCPGRVPQPPLSADPATRAEASLPDNAGAGFSSAASAIARLHKVQKAVDKDLKGPRERFNSLSGLAKLAATTPEFECQIVKCYVKLQPC